MDRADEGIVEVRWQGRLLPCRIPDVRQAVIWLVTLIAAGRGDIQPYQFVLHILGNMKPGTMVHLGFELADDGTWRLSEQSHRQRKLHHAAMHVASCDFQFFGVVAVRMGNGSQRIKQQRSSILCAILVELRKH